MIRHYLKLTWNKKKKHLVLTIELFFAFLVISFLALFIYAALAGSLKTPGFNSDDLVEIHITANDTTRQNISAIKEVKSISRTDVVPYRSSGSSDSVQFADKKISVQKIRVDEELFQMLELTMVSGRQFNAGDRNAIKRPVIINENLKDQLFAGAESEGKILKITTNEYTVIGVAKNLNDPASNERNRPDLFILDTGWAYLVKLNTPITDNIYRKLKRVLPASDEFEDSITPVKEYKDRVSNKNQGLALFMGGVCGFLIINVILGLFSMLCQNINRRRAEIGLRRAAGATANQIYRQIVSEVILLTTIALIPAIIISFQFALFQVFGPTASYYPAMIIGTVTIYILVILCALYPAALASRIQPAEALHEE